MVISIVITMKHNKPERFDCKLSFCTIIFSFILCVYYSIFTVLEKDTNILTVKFLRLVQNVSFCAKNSVINGHLKMCWQKLKKICRSAFIHRRLKKMTTIIFIKFTWTCWRKMNNFLEDENKVSLFIIKAVDRISQCYITSNKRTIAITFLTQFLIFYIS